MAQKVVPAPEAGEFWSTIAHRLVIIKYFFSGIQLTRACRLPSQHPRPNLDLSLA